jgi:hypothetical protein
MPERGETVCTYRVESTPDGLRAALVWHTPNASRRQVIDHLRWWAGALLADPFPASGGPVAYLEAFVGWHRELKETPTGVVDGEPELRLSSFHFGPYPAPEDWPRRPLTDLLAFARADLEGRAPGDP